MVLFKAMVLSREGSGHRFTLDHSPGSRPTLRRELMATSFPRSSCFSAKKKTKRERSSKRLLSASITLKCFQLTISFLSILGFPVGSHN